MCVEQIKGGYNKGDRTNTFHQSSSIDTNFKKKWLNRCSTSKIKQKFSRLIHKSPTYYNIQEVCTLNQNAQLKNFNIELLKTT